MIIKSFTNSKVGNDCLIKDTILLLKIEYDYLVIHQTNYIGGWCTNEPRRTYHDAADERSAIDIFDKLIREVI